MPKSCGIRYWEASGRRYSVRAISLPVESPCACSTRLRECAPSRVKEIVRPRGQTPRPIRSAPGWRRALPRPACARRRIAQAIAGYERILFVQRDLVVVAEGHGDAALRVFRRRFAQGVLGHHQHAPAEASSMAARKPATPAPMTRKSGVIRNCAASQCGAGSISCAAVRMPPTAAGAAGIEGPGSYRGWVNSLACGTSSK